MASRRFLRLMCVALGLGLVAIGCGSGETAELVDERPDAPPGLDADSNLKVIIAPGADLAGSNIEVQCPNGPSFPASALDDIPLIADSGLAGVDEAIESFLSSGEGDFWPQDGWRVLHATEDQVQLVHLSPADRTLSFMSVEGSAGNWKWVGASGASPCPLKTTLPEGLGAVEWELDPSAPAPGPESTSVTLLATERSCRSGQPMGDRMRGPEIVVTDEAILVVLAAVPPDGDFFECPGNPSRSVLIKLGEPLGDREIRDGLDTGADLADFIS